MHSIGSWVAVPQLVSETLSPEDVAGAVEEGLVEAEHVVCLDRRGFEELQSHWKASVARTIQI